MIDEAWVACVDRGTMVQPTQARGLAWLDPGEVPSLASPRPGGSDLREALGWRWIAEKAEARLERERIDQEPGALDSRRRANRWQRPPSRGRRPYFGVRGPAPWERSRSGIAGPTDCSCRGAIAMRQAPLSRPNRSTRRTDPGSASPRTGRLRTLSSRYPIRPRKPYIFMRNIRGTRMA